MTTRIEVNVQTGEIKEIELTPAELEAIAIANAEAAAAKAIEDAKPENIRKVSDETERAIAAQDQAIMALIDQTRAEWAAWAQANFPSLTPAERTRLGIVCWLLAVAVRRLIREGR